MSCTHALPLNCVDGLLSSYPYKTQTNVLENFVWKCVCLVPIANQNSARSHNYHVIVRICQYVYVGVETA